MRACCKCGSEFSPTGNNYRCPPCRKIYDKAWREKRRADGKTASGTRMPREYHRAYEAKYFAEPENRSRRNAQMRAYSKAPKTRLHHKARWAVQRAVQAGRLTKQPCEVCGHNPADAHHDDYNKPLDVRWLCRTHHVEHHAKAEGKS